MAARAIQRLGPQLAKAALASRTFHCSHVDQGGGKWRVKQGFPVNPSMYGPLTDLPDWSFADGRPAPPMKRQLQRKEKNKEFARRVVQLSAEIDHGMEKWKAKQRQQEEMEKEKQVNRLQPKGNICSRASK
ncbi:39S ribosomal protein L52, mitochondrial [Varanus komodoensis]|uniref:Large ribosomal subunit protein mL52 n=1 Tax=Varanus komodoensis TaxID=61221 RepID=A0A8D2Q6B2_VARKO|nr:39S ribosomal protein L52, mitochondrial [Varanus komodoensis]XP_044276845.1 39S ribosomal protein L52, mitochondrial [Varanus komodoensis]